MQNQADHPEAHTTSTASENNTTALPCGAAENQACPGQVDAPARKTSEPPYALLMLLAVLVFVFLIYLPQILAALVNVDKPHERVALGTVQRITYVGGIGDRTQIDTEIQSYLVRGIVSLRKGEALQQRKTLWGRELCGLDHGICAEQFGE